MNLEKSTKTRMMKNKNFKQKTKKQEGIAGVAM